MDYAILQTGSKQYKVKPGDVIDVEKLPVEEGASVELTDVLAVSRDSEVLVGTPLVPDASVLAQVRAQGRDAKIIVFKYKRKVRYRKKRGHRQHYTRLFITAIKLDGEEIGRQERAEPEVKIQEEPAVEEAVDEVQAPSADEPIDEAEEQVAVESADEVVDEVQAPSADEPIDEAEKQVAVESADEVVDEVQAPSADEPIDEAEEQVAVEPADQVVDEVQAPSAGEPIDEAEEQVAVESADEVVDEVQTLSADEPKDEGEK